MYVLEKFLMFHQPVGLLSKLIIKQKPVVILFFCVCVSVQVLSTRRGCVSACVPLSERVLI